MGILSPLKKLQVRASARSLKLHFCATVHFRTYSPSSSLFALSPKNKTLLFYHRNKRIKMSKRSSAVFIDALHSQCSCVRHRWLAPDPGIDCYFTRTCHMCFVASCTFQAFSTSKKKLLWQCCRYILYTDELVRMSSSLLAGLGVTLDEGNLYSQLLTAVKDKQLGRDVVTNHQ